MTVQENIYFDKDLDYDTVLEKLNQDFNLNWSVNDPSPHGSVSDFDVIKLLGAGSFGAVKLCRDKNTKLFYAIKCLRKDHIIKWKQAKNVCSEKRVMKSIKFPFLMSLEFSFKDNHFLYLAMPYVNGGDIYGLHKKVTKFTEPQAKFYAAQVFLALEYMHSLNLIYRDLKMENILLEHHGYIKLTDFGFTKMTQDHRTYTFCGTPEYLAPEIIQAKSYGNGIDWWAFGVLLYEFVSGWGPFSKNCNNVLKMYSKICTADYKFPLYFSQQLQHLIENLLQVDPCKRLGILINGNRDIKSHNWFDSIDWYDILNRKIEPPYIPQLTDIEDSSNLDGQLDPEENDEIVPSVDKYDFQFADF